MTDDKGILIKNIYYMLTYAFQELRHNSYEKSPERSSTASTTCLLK